MGQMKDYPDRMTEEQARRFGEAADLSLFKKATPFSDKLYEALSRVESREDEEFPIAGPSFNKYFRNPDFCNEDKWTEAAKVLKAVRKDYMEGE